jgi:methylenetetrahydrofolate dehydrogenase (NADP+)/methenyltetrahydrofolate cyclohydrolase
VSAEVINGRAIAIQVRREVRLRVERAGARPGFVDLLVGDDPASVQYVGMKNRDAERAGMVWFDRRLPATATEVEIIDTIEALNRNPAIHGVLVQLPLPPESHADPFAVLSAIDPKKDVDGLTPISQGCLTMGEPGFAPATPLGVVELLHRAEIPIDGRDVVVIGRSLLLGRPLSIMLSQRGAGANATVTLCHTGTADLAAHVRRADIVVACAGKPHTVTAAMVKPGAAVIDCGTNVAEDGTTVGDVEFDEVAEVAGWITPVPGGAGPMTIAMLLHNVATAAGC